MSAPPRPPGEGGGRSGRWRRFYGAPAWHLVAVAGCLAFTGYVATLISQVPDGIRIAIWLIGAAVVHDLILWPLYTLADLVVGAAGPGRRTAATRRAPCVPWVNHVRVPAVLSLLLLAVSWPLVLGRSAAAFHTATGLRETPFANRYLAVAGGMFALSALAYGTRWVRARRSAGTGA